MKRTPSASRLQLRTLTLHHLALVAGGNASAPPAHPQTGHGDPGQPGSNPGEPAPDPGLPSGH